MSWQFRRRITIAPGIRLNISKGGISTSFGVCGANITAGRQGVYLNTGIPGTGIYNRQKLGNSANKNSGIGSSLNQKSEPKSTSSFGTITFIGIVILVIVATMMVISDAPIKIIYFIIAFMIVLFIDFCISTIVDYKGGTSKSKFSYASEISKAKLEIENTQDQIKREILGKYVSCLNLHKIASEKENIITALKKKIQKKDKIEYLEQLKILEQEYGKLENELNSIQFDADKLLTEEQKVAFKRVCASFNKLVLSKKVLIMNKSTQDDYSTVKTSIKTKEVEFYFGVFDFMKSDFSIPMIEDFEGVRYYIYPGFIIRAKSSTRFEILPIKEARVWAYKFQYTEKGTVPDDSKIVGHTYKYANKDGSQDRRYSYNPMYSIVEYAFLSLPAFSLNFQVSNVDAVDNFKESISNFIKIKEKNNTNNDMNEIPGKIRINLKYKDSLFVEAAKLVIENQSANASLLQRKLSLGYNRAGRIIDQLQDSGIVGIYNNGKREVLISDFNKLYFVNAENKKTNNLPDFNIDYYQLLKDFGVSISNLSESLKDDELLIDFLTTSDGYENPKQIVENLVRYDIGKITEYLSGENDSLDELMGLGSVLLCLAIKGNSKENILKLYDFETLNRTYKTGKFLKLIDDLRSISKQSLPTNQLGTTSEDLPKIKLALPFVLKKCGSDLSEKYAICMYQLANIIAKADGKVTEDEKKRLLIIYDWLNNPYSLSSGIKNMGGRKEETSKMSETLEDALSELNSLIGLTEVKNQITTLMNFIKVQKARESSGLKSASLSYHVVFTGNPGTGKTTVARILAKIYKHLGILKVGQLIETDRSGLVAEFVGQTAPKVNKTVDSALDGVLFIDEAYSIGGESKDDYGKEAVATLIKRMEDDRDRLILILAGYTDEMRSFIDSNPGFQSRFTRYVEFPDYNPEELFEIFQSSCNKLDYRLSEEARTKLKSVFENAYAIRDKSFGNGRFVRNIFERTLEKQANRITKESSLTKEILTTIMEDDIKDVSISNVLKS